MKGTGWIKLHRSLLDSSFSKDPEYAWLWVVLLLRANHKELSFIFNNRPIVLNEGQLIVGRKKLSEETGINEHKIFRAMKCFESAGQIEQQSTNKFTLVTILNWGKYQGELDKVEQQDEQPVSNKRTTSEQPVSTYKNVKNKKKSKKTKIEFPKNSIQVELSRKLHNILKDNIKGFPPVVSYQIWGLAIHEMLNEDLINPDDIAEVIEWFITDDFYKGFISSTSLLRKHYGTMCLKMNSKKKKQQEEEQYEKKLKPYRKDQ
jgi:predicted transcriptional regulator